MPYVTSIAIPLVFEAADDREANIIAHKLADFYARLEFDTELRERYAAEVSDAPQPLELSEVVPYQPQREVPLDAFAAILADEELS